MISGPSNRGEAKYTHLGKVVRAALCLSHGQADIERGFSLNKAILSDRTALSERTLCGLRTVKDVIEQYSSVVEVPITRGILSAQRNAYQKYKAALDAAKTAAANEERQAKRERKIDNRVKELKEKKLKLETSQLQAEMMINEGSDRLKASINFHFLTLVPSHLCIIAATAILPILPCLLYLSQYTSLF
jgi:hypothetical protein